LLLRLCNGADQHGREPIRRVLEWLLNRDLTDADMAAALDVHPSNYSRHKDDDGYP
jgi:hypothetical protein